MRKLSWFLIAIVLATYTIHLWATADPTATYVLRDGCLLALLALFIIAWQAPPLDASMASLQPIKQSNRTPTAVATELTATGGVLLGTAIACLFAGAVLPNFLATVVATRSAEILRGLGWGLLLIATIWPRAWQRRWHTANANVEHSAPPIRPKMQRVSPATVPWPSLLFLLLLNSGLR
ncbi:MAG: hypothetical protein KDE19_14980, partial [Caldilineaceae bacterium]|nr:hypothetical protein [Caldilineaceae bacterium]